MLTPPCEPVLTIPAAERPVLDAASAVGAEPVGGDTEAGDEEVSLGFGV
jgi:hypothetical protein